MKMEPLTNLQVAIKNDVDVLYFACVAPIHIYFGDDGLMDKMLFLQTWKEIPGSNEQQYTVDNPQMLNADAVCARLQLSNIFTVARRTVDGREMLYHSVKFTNGVWLLAELNLPGVNEPSGNAITLSLKSRNTVVLEDSKAVIEAILKA